MKRFFYFICFFCFGLLLWSCSDIKEYSDIPEIGFKNLVIDYRLDNLDNLKKTAILTFSFVDGDGDIGDWSGSNEKYSKIHYLWLYKKIPDAAKPDYFILDTFKFSIETSSQIPWDRVMDKSGAHNKVLKGTIEIQIDPPLIGIEELDSMLIDFHIYDRARNKSNVERTPMFCIHNSLGDIK